MPNSSTTRRPRPPKPSRRRGNLTIRIQDGIRAELQQEADRHQRSLSEEVEDRLGRSLLDQKLMVDALDLAFGRQLAGLLLAFGHTMQEAGWFTVGAVQRLQRPARRDLSFEDWPSDPIAFEQVTQAATRILQQIRPKGDPLPPWLEALDKEFPVEGRVQALGKIRADRFLWSVATESPAVSDRVNLVRERWEPEVLARLVERLAEEKGGEVQ